MRIAFYVVGQSEVDYVCQVVNVKSACSHVCCHKKLGQMLAELLHRQVTLLLAEVAVEALCVVSVVYQLVGNLLCLELCAAEDDTEYLRVKIHYSFQCQVFVLGIHKIVYMVYVLSALVAAAHHNLLILTQITLRYLLYLLAHGGREEKGVAVFRHSLKYLIYTVGEAHVEHLVSLVEHHIVHVLQIRLSAVHEVDESSRSGNDYLCSVAQGSYLVLYGSSSIHSHDVHSLHVFREVFQVVGNLQAQLSRRTEHQRLCLTTLRVELLQHWNTERGSLARTGLSQCDHVVSVAKQIRDDFLLYGHWALETQFLDGVANLFADA